MSETLAETLASPAFIAALAEAEQALTRILHGDPQGYESLFADRQDITLGNPFGPFQKGRAGVSQALANAASKYRGADEIKIERIAEYGNGDFVCLVEIESARGRMTGREGTLAISARVTTLFERQDASWRLIHRHADLMPG